MQLLLYVVDQEFLAERRGRCCRVLEAVMDSFLLVLLFLVSIATARVRLLFVEVCGYT
jgi:hypothetical protein